MPISHRTFLLVLLLLWLLFAIKYMVLKTESFNFFWRRKDINNTERKCEVEKDINSYLKCRRKSILRHCGDVCNTTPEPDESKYYNAEWESYDFVIV